jgi:hypothetical protein
MPFPLNTKLSVVFLLAFVIFLAACKKSTVDTTTMPDLITTTSSNVSGFVTDENNTIVLGAVVKIGSLTVSTDKYGYFEVTNATVVKNAATVTVTKTGYFNSIKTYIATNGKPVFFRIKLIPKTIVGSINAITGGSVSLPNGLSISLPANAAVTVSGITPYTGTIHVAAHLFDPTSTNFYQQVSGDFRGLDKNGVLKLLTNYSMGAIEMLGDAGQLLQIATGKKATLSLPIPASVTNAPSSVPNWYFDESLGLWKEETVAIKAGNSYVFDVSHLTIWFCGPMTNYVNFSCTIVDNNGNPLPNILVGVHALSQIYNGYYGYTNASGYISVSVSQNSQLQVDVSGGSACSNLLYTQTITTTTTDISLGSIAVQASAAAIVTGNVKDCNAVPVSNGYLITIQNGVVTRYALSASGTFNFTMPSCAATNLVTFIAENVASGQQSAVQNFNISPGNNNVGTIMTCGPAIDRYFNYSVDGVPYTFTAPADTIFVIDYAIDMMHVGGMRGISSSIYSVIYFQKSGIAAGSNMILNHFLAGAVPGALYPGTTAQYVHITEYGPIGGYIAGNFSGTLNGYNITCNFRVIRRF